MESNSLELRVMYCKDLKAFNFFQKLSVYAVVSIVSDNPTKKLEQQQQHRTPTDKEGDGNPEWNHEMRFDLRDNNSIFYQDCDFLFLHFDLRSEGPLVFGDKSIGEVRVPFKDLVQELNGIVRFVSYEVRTSDGKPNGALNFSYKVKEKGTSTGSSSLGSQIDGYPILNPHHTVYTHSSTADAAAVPCPFSSPSSEVHYPSLDLRIPYQEVYYSPENFYSMPPRPSLLPPRPPHFPPPWIYHDDYKPYEFAGGYACCNVVEQHSVESAETASSNYYNGSGGGIGRGEVSPSWNGMGSERGGANFQHWK